MTQKWLTTKEAAEISGYSTQYVLRLANRGTVEARKFGHVWQVNRDSLTVYLAVAGKSGDQRRGPREK